MRFLQDYRLYTDTAYCLSELSKASARRDPGGGGGELFHVFWSGPIGRRQTFAIRSILSTQTRPLIWLWSDANGSPRPEDVPDGVVLRSFHPLEEMRGTPLEGHDELNTPHDPVAQSDLFRLLVLYNYGGVYADADVLFLRDLADLAGVGADAGEFAYQWSAQPHCNTAVLRLRQGGQLAAAFMERAILSGTTHPNAVFHFDADAPLLVLPCAAFDPAWRALDGEEKCSLPVGQFEDFFRRFGLIRHRRQRHIVGLADWFPGAFAYHWHGCSTVPDHEDSYFGVFDRELEQRLQMAPMQAAREPSQPA